MLYHFIIIRVLRSAIIVCCGCPQGVQAQTVANFYLAFEAELTIVPVMNKIDLKVARPEVVTKQIEKMFDFKREEILRVSVCGQARAVVNSF